MVEGLKKAGVRVSFYDKNVQGDRERVTNEVADNTYGVKFHKADAGDGEREVKKMTKQENGVLYHKAMEMQSSFMAENGRLPLEMGVFTDKHFVIVNNVDEGNIVAIRAFNIENDKNGTIDAVRRTLEEYNSTGFGESVNSLITDAGDVFGEDVRNSLSREFGRGQDENSQVLPMGDGKSSDRGTDASLDSGTHLNDADQYGWFEAQNDLEKVAGMSHKPTNSNYIEGNTDSGDKWVLRVSNHPISEHQLYMHDQDDADAVLSLVVDDEFDAREQHQDRFHDEDNGHYQFVFTSDFVKANLTSIKDGIEWFKKTGDDTLIPVDLSSEVVYRTGSGVSAKSADTIEQKRDAVLDMGERLNTNVRIITDTKELEGATEKQKSAKGWFNLRTGNVVINLANCESVEDAVATMGHETIGHKGMRELLGDNYDAFLDEVYNHLNGELKRRVAQKAGRMFVEVDGLAVLAGELAYGGQVVDGVVLYFALVVNCAV